MTILSPLIKIAENFYVPSNFEEEHFYYADPDRKQKYTGISSILDTVYSKPFLTKWSANCAVDYIKEANNLNEDTLLEARTAYTKKSKKACDFGSNTHSLAEVIIKNAIKNNGGKLRESDIIPNNPQIRNLVYWALEKNVIFTNCEERLYSRDMFTAGTCDFICMIGGQRILGDLKTSSRISPSYHLQTASYSIMTPIKIDGTVIVRTGKGGSVYDVNTRRYKTIDAVEDFDVEYRDNDTLLLDQEAFRNALNLYRWRARHNDT